MKEHTRQPDLLDQKRSNFLWILTICVTISGLLLSANTSWANDRRRMVEFHSGTSNAVKTQIIQDSDSTLLKLLPIVNAAAIELPPAPDTQTAESYLLSQPEVKAVHQDPALKAQK